MPVLRPYLAIFSARFRSLLQYRVAALAGCGTQVFWGLIRMMIFMAFYRSSTADHPMSLRETINYVWLGQASLLLVMIHLDSEVADMIHSGNVVYEMVRPVHLYRLWFSRAIAGRLAPLLLRMPPIMLLGSLFFGLGPPAGLTAGVLWVVAMTAALVLSSAIATLLTLSMLWTIVGTGIYRLSFGFLFVFSGLVVPLPLYPEWAQKLLAILPFRGLADTPYRIYMGHMNTAEALPAIVQQVVWAALLILLGHWLIALGTRRLVVQGG